MRLEHLLSGDGFPAGRRVDSRHVDELTAKKKRSDKDEGKQNGKARNSAFLLVLTDLFYIIEKKEAGLPKPRSWTATNRDS